MGEGFPEKDSAQKALLVYLSVAMLLALGFYKSLLISILHKADLKRFTTFYRCSENLPLTYPKTQGHARNWFLLLNFLGQLYQARSSTKDVNLEGPSTLPELDSINMINL